MHFIASLAYASPTQLGYDPTMTLRWKRSRWLYDIVVDTLHPDGTKESVTYDVYRIIFDSAYNICGRVTRVYEAHIKVDETETQTKTSYTIRHRFVIKDVWTDINRRTEGATLELLLEGATPAEKKQFLTVVQHGIVQIDGQNDSTQDLILKKQTFFGTRSSFTEGGTVDPDDHVFDFREVADELESRSDDGSEYFEPEIQMGYTTPLFPLHHYETPGGKSSLSDKSHGGLAHHTHREVDPPIVYSPKNHYRIVFDEVAPSLMALAGSGKLKASEVHRALIDVTRGESHL